MIEHHEDYIGRVARVKGDTRNWYHEYKGGELVTLTDYVTSAGTPGWRCKSIGDRAEWDVCTFDLELVPPGQIGWVERAGKLVEAGVPATEAVRVTSSTGGQKDAKLARYDQIPAYPLRLLAERYGMGNAKYPVAEGELDNWRKGYKWSLSFSALMRHAWAFWRGEDIDAETGQPHLVAVIWHCMALLEWGRHPKLVKQFDDRQCPREP